MALKYRLFSTVDFQHLSLDLVSFLVISVDVVTLDVVVLYAFHCDLPCYMDEPHLLSAVDLCLLHVCRCALCDPHSLRSYLSDLVAHHSDHSVEVALGFHVALGQIAQVVWRVEKTWCVGEVSRV